MTKGSRILVLVAALAMGLVYVLPLWRIELEAPQYPEGLGMVIRIDDVAGVKTHDLSNINNLNHYIGMKRIEPDAIPELVFMPVILGGLILLGIGVAALGRRRLLYGWVALFLAVSVAGLVDFWKWEYDYGHDLDDETAIIKIPGMSYQPPLIGSRQILNFTAHSWPGAGGWILIAAAATGVVVAGAELRRSRRDRAPSESGAPVGDRPRATSPTVPVATVLLVGAGMVATGCGAPEPRPLAWGVDACAHCHMGLVEEAYGTEAVSGTGKAWVFDSVECLAAWLHDDPDAAAVVSVWVTDFANPGTLVSGEEAFYLRSPTLTSPMGMGLTAFARAEDRDGARTAFGGDALDWSEVRSLVAAGVVGAGSGGHAHAATQGAEP